MRDDRITVADRLAIVDEIGKLPAWCGRGVKDMLMSERHSGQFEERKHLEAVAVVVGHAEKFGIRIKRDHGGFPRCSSPV